MTARGRLVPAIEEMLREKGILTGHAVPLDIIREFINDLYLYEIRRLRDRQHAGEIPLREYSGHVSALRQRYAILSIPTSEWFHSPRSGGKLRRA